MSAHKILFVCKGNICRSPAAECVMQKFVHESEFADSMAVDSVGTIAFHEGNPADPRMIATAAKRGYELRSIARAIQAEDLEKYDLILAMDQKNFRHLKEMDSQGQYQSKIQNFTDYCAYHTEKDVPDPYYGGDEGFDVVLDMLEDGCRELLKALQAQLPKKSV